jgi:hypothetical protein
LPEGVSSWAKIFPEAIVSLISEGPLKTIIRIRIAAADADPKARALYKACLLCLCLKKKVVRAI